MSNIKKLMMTAAGGAGPNVEELFSIYLYDGAGSTQTITNGIDLDGEGGLVWLKQRSDTQNNTFFDTERGQDKRIVTNSTDQEYTNSGALSFNSDGFTTGNYAFSNTNGDTYASWTFRKAPKFFDIVTYTGNGTAGKTVSHNLGSVPGMIVVKRTDTSGEWMVYHRGTDSSSPENFRIFLNRTSTAAADLGVWHYTAPTDTQFTVGYDTWVNANGGSYVAYLFAHNDGDGEFGSTGDQDIIKCGSYTGSNTEVDVNLGFEPQFVLIKNTSNNGRGWLMFDNMRGITTNNAYLKDDMYLQANENNSEATGQGWLACTPTGFRVEATSSSYRQINYNNDNYIYMAIRRGPMAVPESATDVFAIDQGDGAGSSTTAEFSSDWPVDMGINKATSGSNSQIHTRLADQTVNYINYNEPEGNSAAMFDFQEGYYGSDKSSSYYAWMWRRAPAFFDVVMFDGTSSAQTISHNLGVTPEMMWVKRRDSLTNGFWHCYHSANGPTKSMTLSTSNSVLTASTLWDDTSPTATDFTVGTYWAGKTVAYLFASLDGISKVGSYTGNGSNGKVIDCGFSNGARFVLIKCTSSSGNWWVFDTERGINAGNDPMFKLDATQAQITSYDEIDSHSSGFIVNYSAGEVNINGEDYIFYAVA